MPWLFKSEPDVFSFADLKARPGKREPWTGVRNYQARNYMRDSMEPGDMPDVDPAFEKAHQQLTNPEYRLGTKHMILISDGDHWDSSRQMIQKIKDAKITCTTVCITTHGLGLVPNPGAVARLPRSGFSRGARLGAFRLRAGHRARADLGN